MLQKKAFRQYHQETSYLAQHDQLLYKLRIVHEKIYKIRTIKISHGTLQQMTMNVRTVQI